MAAAHEGILPAQGLTRAQNNMVRVLLNVGTACEDQDLVRDLADNDHDSTTPLHEGIESQLSGRSPDFKHSEQVLPKSPDSVDGGPRRTPSCLFLLPLRASPRFALGSLLEPPGRGFT